MSTKSKRLVVVEVILIVFGNSCPDPAVGGELRSPGSNEGREVGLRRLEMVDTGSDPAVRNHSNEGHKAGLRRLGLERFHMQENCYG